MKLEVIKPEQYIWLIITYDNQQYEFTQREYELIKEAQKAGIKMIHFSEVSLAVADIRRMEKIHFKEQVKINWEENNEEA